MLSPLWSISPVKEQPTTQVTPSTPNLSGQTLTQDPVLSGGIKNNGGVAPLHPAFDIAIQSVLAAFS